MGMGSPEPGANREQTQVDNLCYVGTHSHVGTQVDNLCYEEVWATGGIVRPRYR